MAALARSVAAKPALSFPRALSSAQLEAGYRFLDNVKATPNLMLRPHVEQTLGRAREHAEVLVAHDSSTISFSSDGSREGLMSARGEKQSFLMHCSLAIRADGTRRPEGVLAASYHVPTKAKDGELQDRWLDHVREIHALGQAPAKTIHLMDREADDFEILELLSSLGARFVVRVQHNRKLQEVHLRDVAETVEIRAEREVPLSKRGSKAGPKQRRTHPPRTGRRARLAISSKKVLIQRNPRAPSPEETLQLNLVRVWEPEPPEGQRPVEWLLYTSEPVETAEQMLQMVDWYRAQILEIDELEVLRCIVRKPLSDAPSVHEAVYAIAALGGHLKHNGARPGESRPVPDPEDRARIQKTRVQYRTRPPHPTRPNLHRSAINDEGGAPAHPSATQAHSVHPRGARDRVPCCTASTDVDGRWDPSHPSRGAGPSTGPAATGPELLAQQFGQAVGCVGVCCGAPDPPGNARMTRPKARTG